MMIFRILILVALFCAHTTGVFSQDMPKWDDTKSKDWPVQAKKITIPSTADGTQQSAYFYAAPGTRARPLIISLHTWSSDFQQKDTIVNLCIEKGYNYIHPDFRGPNRRPEACGSELVIRDIDDAISWAIANTKTDPENIHVIGVSGGGYATVLTYMRSRHKIRSFSAYAGLYNLIDWYQESLGRKARYAGDVAASTSGNREVFNMEEAKLRSPFYMAKPVTDRTHSKLSIYCGIHDGYTGSVPISHSLKMYNKLVNDFNPDARLSMIPEEYIYTMVNNRSLPGVGEQGTILGRKIIYKNNYQQKVNITVFEGGHEMIPGDVLAHVPSLNILAFGDSNGALEHGWVNQLKTIRPADHIVNACISGNTIGFDNLDRKELNTLKNVDNVFAKAPWSPDAVVVMLGTNDCKAIFAGKIREVPANLDKLIRQIREKTNKNKEKQVPIFIVSPPPFADDAFLTEKYKGGAGRIEYLIPEFRKVAKKNGCHFIDTHSKIKSVYKHLTQDGIHLTAQGQYILASMMDDDMNAILKPEQH
jgi:lysophospholipase L1-like esterase/pimeloyl-ACP methyl ester carboxylesterase